MPPEAEAWETLESAARMLFKLYGYREIRTPVMEETSLFIRSVGETTDIVQKQMFTFEDRGGRKISLRPEATASVVRSYLEHNLHKKGGLIKLFYIGPMFRSERPQAGRSRQFHQIGVEAIGSDSPYLDGEVITLMVKLFEEIGLKGYQIKVNSLGCEADKKKISRILKESLEDHLNLLCADCKDRLQRNAPFRVLDCKKQGCRSVVRMLPPVTDSLCPICQGHFQKVKETLELLGVAYVVDPYLVRGLDYYTKTAFEVVHPNLGAQDAIGAGGRYDNLVGDMGGPDMGATGFAVGVERLMMALGPKAKDLASLPKNRIFVATVGEIAYKKGMKLVELLRSSGIWSDIDYQKKSLKAQMRAASKSGCNYVIIIGDEELKRHIVTLRDMSTGKQSQVETNKIVKELKSLS